MEFYYNEVHILDRNDKCKSFLLQTATKLHETGDNFQFLLGEINKNGMLDLYCISKYNTGTKCTEVHILNGNDNFQSFFTKRKFQQMKLEILMILNQNYNKDGRLNLYCIKKFETKTNFTEICIIRGNDYYQSVITSFATKLPETDKYFSFCPCHQKKGNKCIEIICLKIQYILIEK